MLFLQGVNRYFSSFFNKTAMLYAVFPNYFHFVSNFKPKSGCKKKTKRQNVKISLIFSPCRIFYLQLFILSDLLYISFILVNQTF